MDGSLCEQVALHPHRPVCHTEVQEESSRRTRKHKTQNLWFPIANSYPCLRFQTCPLGTMALAVGLRGQKTRFTPPTPVWV